MVSLLKQDSNLSNSSNSTVSSIQHFNDSVDLLSISSPRSPRTPLAQLSDEDLSAIKSPSSSSSCHETESSSPSNQHNQHNQHQQMVGPRPERDFYRYPVKVHRAAYKYEVCEISRVRAAYDLQSESVTELPHGTVVSVEEIWSNRARISSPLCGWMSVYSMRGQQLLMPLDENAEKIGGHIMFQDEQRQIAYAEVTGYDHHCGLHSVMLQRAGLQWVNLNDPNLRYIPKRAPNNLTPKQMKEAFAESHCISISST